MVEEQISIRPGVGMLGLFPHMKYQPWYALSELVDNAIQSYISNRDRLHAIEPEYCLAVSITIDRRDGGLIIVRDNAAGISHTDWERAFRVAEPPADATGLSQFGIGMKAACCWFSREWTLRTSHLGEDVTRTITFDVPKIVAAREESLEVRNDPSAKNVHFTEIRMHNLHRTPATRTVTKIKEYLGSIYRQFLRNGDVVIYFNGEPVTYVEPPILTAPRYNDKSGPNLQWRKDVDIRLDSGRRVKGFVGIREKGATSQAGLALLYRNKVVTGSGEDAYKPEDIFGRSNSFRSQRLFGELHMDDFAVTYTKDALVWYDEEDEFIELLRDQLDAEPLPLLKQAENYRAREQVPVPEESANSVLDGIVGAFSAYEFSLDEGSSRPLDHEYLPVASTRHDTAPIAGRSIQLSADGEVWQVTLQLIADESVTDWLTVSVPDDHQLSLTVNQAHPFMRNFCELPGQELEPVWRVAIALGLAQEQARLGGAKMPGLVVRKVNDLLRSVLAHKN